MLGFRSSEKKPLTESFGHNGDLAKVFFDKFSNRVTKVEEALQGLSAEFEKLKMSTERGQISDLVLLERLKRSERLIKESVGSIKTAIDNMSLAEEVKLARTRDSTQLKDSDKPESTVQGAPAIVSHILSPTGEVGSLPSITTPTELQVLTLLGREGPKSAPEIGRAVGRSREHTARLMKKLFEEGYIRRDQARIPFRYSVVERLRQNVRRTGSMDEEKEAVSVPQN